MQTKTFWSFLPILLFPFLLFAQSQTLRGTVLDKQSETPLIGATYSTADGDLHRG
jgi:hypothetical protein